MKKQILSLGKALSKKEQKDVLGGLTFPKEQDECDELTEVEYYPSCPCFIDSQCPRVYIRNKYDVTSRPGVCSGGKCVAG